MRTLHRLIPSTRGARRRALILTLYVTILAVALSWHAFQHRADTVYVYMQGDVVYAQARSSSEPYPLFPLAPECRLRWTNGAEEASASQDEMVTMDTGAWIPADSVVALSFASIGDLSMSRGRPWLTLRSKAGDVQVMAHCPPPPPTTHHFYVYVSGQHLFIYDTLDQSTELLMPLRRQLVWSGEETGMFTTDALVTRPEDKMGYVWLPQGATVLGDFETGYDVSVNNLDETQIQLRYGVHELMLVSYD